MSEFETEHLKDIQSNCFWAGFLIDLPKDKAWQIADEIVEAIEFAVKKANGVNSDNGKCAIPVVSISLGSDAKEEKEKILTAILYKHCDETDNCKIREVDFEEIVKDVINET